jgi:hypothetical protein
MTQRLWIGQAVSNRRGLLLRKCARLAAGVLFLRLVGAPLRVQALPPGFPFSEGPAQVRLGTVATLQLPEGWRFVAPKDLPAYFAGSPRRAGAWDLGVALAGSEGAVELRFVFEPVGWVAATALPDPAVLLVKAQGLARERAARTPDPDGPRELADWRWEPNYDAPERLLRFGGWWRRGEAESVDLHLRWLGRRGVLKLDWSGDQEDANAFIAATEAAAEGLRFNDGEELEAVAPGDRAAGLDLEALVLGGLLGRAVLRDGAPPRDFSLWQWIAAGLLAAFASAWAALGLHRRLRAWLDARRQARGEEARLSYLEKKLGGRAEEVEELEEDQDQEARP